MVADAGWRSAWAKSYPQHGGPVTDWLPLYQHLDDTAAIAGLLVDHWISPQVLARIGEDLPDGIGGVRTVVAWLAGVHDVGKASPAFAVQVPTLADRMRVHGLRATKARAIAACTLRLARPLSSRHPRRLHRRQYGSELSPSSAANSSLTAPLPCTASPPRRRETVAGVLTTMKSVCRWTS